VRSYLKSYGPGYRALRDDINTLDETQKSEQWQNRKILTPKTSLQNWESPRPKRLVSIDLLSGMGWAVPIVASPHRYCGTLTLGPGDGFNFHLHPRQDEVIDGMMEGWAKQDRSVLGPGDLIFAPAGTVHASFNTWQRPLKLFIVLSPLIAVVKEEWRMIDGDGWEMVDVSGEEPWISIRKT
jgi:mannose-6-phosphate isomerase-like protein (cupin superfamily)